MRRMLEVAAGIAALGLVAVPAAQAGGKGDDACVQCHTKVTPGVVGDWKLSKHSGEGVGCADCHGDSHKTAKDAAKAVMPTADKCGECHEERLEQYKKGKHALGWASMNAMPTIHMQARELTEGMKGCGACHKVGLKTAKDIAELRKKGITHGFNSCDSCHTRHTFSVKEARSPQACRTCHMGFDHAQWEMYSGSKHGVRHQMKVEGALPPGAAAPTCQSCHMQGGDHAVGTGWGFLAVRLPMPDASTPEGKQWAADRVTILKALGVLDPNGKPTARLDVVKAAKVATLTQEEFDAQRTKMLSACTKCHAGSFAQAELEKTDQLIRQADRLMAQAIDEVVGLYRDGVLAKPANYASNYPDILTFHDAPTEIEQRLFVMFLKHRMRVFQGGFHMNPDYSLWYGWSAMQQDLTFIKEKAASMRAEYARSHKKGKHHKRGKRK